MVAVLIDEAPVHVPAARRRAEPAERSAGVPMPALPVDRIALVVVGLLVAVIALRLVQGGPGDTAIDAVEPAVAGESVVEVLPGDSYERIAVRLGADVERAELLARRNGGLEPRAGTYLVVPAELVG